MSKTVLMVDQDYTITLPPPPFPLDETLIDAVRGLIVLKGFRPSISKSRARRSHAATSDSDKQICFVLMPRT